MATLYRPTIVSYTLPGGKTRTSAGQRVTKDTPGVVRSESKSKVWYGRYTDGAGKRQQVKLSASKEIARRMLAKLAGDAQLAGVGITDPFAEHRGRTLTEHLDDYRRYLTGKENCAEHVQKTISQCQTILDGCKFRQMGDVEESAVVELLAALRQGEMVQLPAKQEWFTVDELAELFGISHFSIRRYARRGMLAGEGKGKEQRYARADIETLAQKRSRGIGIETSNHYTTAIKSFTRWLVKMKRTASDPLVSLSLLNADLDVRHARRALSAPEFDRFLDATVDGRPFRGLTGSDRIILYCVAARTGLRASELGSLSPESFDLNATPPTVTVAAAYSKHRRVDVLPLKADIVQLLRGYLSGKEPGQPVWPGTWTEVGAEMVRRDLETAGIPYADQQGRVLDFHGLRHTFITHLVESGIHPKVAQVLARHSTITLTMDRYTHLRALDVAADLDKLPDLRPATGKKRRHKQA